MSDGATAFVLAGGGSVGAVQVGMLLALAEAGIRPDFILGTSVGAINAACFAGRPDLAGVLDLAGIWCELHRSDIFPLSVGGVIGALHHADSLIDPRNLRHLLETRLPFARLEDAQLPLHVMATDQNGLGVRLSSGPAVEAILASAAVPGNFPPVSIDGRLLMDGSVAANTPLRVAAGLGAARIVLLPTGQPCSQEPPPRGAIARAFHAVTLLVRSQLMLEMETMPAGATVHVAPSLCPLAVLPFDFGAARELIERARSQTVAWIAGGGLTRPSHAGELGDMPPMDRAPDAAGLSSRNG